MTFSALAAISLNEFESVGDGEGDEGVGVKGISFVLLGLRLRGWPDNDGCGEIGISKSLKSDWSLTAESCKCTEKIRNHTRI